VLRFLRFILMSATLFVATAAQLIFDFGALSLPLPPGMVQQLPWLAQLAAWRAGELDQLAFWAALSAGLLFGLVAPGWPVWPQAAAEKTANRQATWPVLAAAGAGGAAIAVALALAAGAPEAGWMHWVWLGSAALLVAAAAGATLPVHAQRPRQPLTGQGWILLLLALLAVTALLVGWGGTALPITVDRATARNGLAAANLLANPDAGFFAASRVGMPGVAHAPLALLLWLFRDGLAALHFLAGLAALLLVGGVWLLASELFRRPDETPGALALLAAGLSAVAIPTLHFGRTTPTLLATSVAVLAGWLLLRGLRRDNALAFAASGMMAGAAALLDRSGLAAPVILALWWLGAAILRAGGAPPARWGQFWWWLAGLTVAVGPVVGLWLHNPADFAAYARGLHLAADFAPIWPQVDLWGNLRNSFLGLMWLPDASTTVAFPGHFVHSLVAPLLWLAAGALLVNLDRFVGWALTAWLLAPLLLASVTTAATPDWTQMLLLLPGVSLALAFVGSRFYAAWRTPESDLPTAPAAYVLAGLLTALAFNGAVAYHTFAATSSDVTSYVGRAVRAAAPQPAVLVASADHAMPSPADEIIQFLTLPGAAPALLDAALLPPTLPPGSHLLLLPSDAAALDAVRTRYPGGVLTVTRDLRATPRLLVYRLP
jgi:hypothetical protein